MRIPSRVRGIELPQFDLLNDLAAGWRTKGADVITLGQGLPGFDPPSVAVEALRRSLDDPASHVYSTDAGIAPLRRALTASLRPLQAEVDPDREVIITAGGNQAFQLALTTLIDPDDEVVLTSPYFLNHEMAVRSVAGIPVEAAAHPGRGFAATWDDIAPHVTPRTAAVVIVSPSNPTGAVIDPAEVRRIVEQCAARQIVVIADETYLRFSYDADAATAAALSHWRQNVVIVGSFSKTFAVTGWRCGYLIGNAEMIGQAMKVHDCMVICAPVPVQRAVAAILEAEPDYPARWRPELRARRDFIVSALGQIPGVTAITPAGSFFVMARIEEMHDSRAVALDLLDQQQVVTIPGAFFGSAGEGFLRLSYGSAPRERLQQACERLSIYLAQSQTRH